MNTLSTSANILPATIQPASTSRGIKEPSWLKKTIGGINSGNSWLQGTLDKINTGIGVNTNSSINQKSVIMVGGMLAGVLVVAYLLFGKKKRKKR